MDSLAASTGTGGSPETSGAVTGASTGRTSTSSSVSTGTHDATTAGASASVGGKTGGAATGTAGLSDSTGSTGSGGGHGSTGHHGSGGHTTAGATTSASASTTTSASTSGSSTSNGTGGGALIQAPLTGNVTQGTWQSGDLPFTGLPSGKPFHYNFLLPDGYSTANTYPIIVYEHEDYEGTGWYDSGGDPLTLVDSGMLEFDSFNTIYFRTHYPSIVIVPYCDQSDGNGGQGNDENINFGGYGDSPGSDPNEQAVVALVKSFEQSYSVDPNKVYATGDSLGGIGTWALAIDYNQVNGLVDKVFTAFMPFAGELVRNSESAQSQASQLSSVPVFAVSGAGDTTSNVAEFNEPLWQQLAGNSNYPGPPSGGQAGATTYWYLEDPALGHDVWDTYRDWSTLAGKPIYDWLFSQGH